MAIAGVYTIGYIYFIDICIFFFLLLCFGLCMAFNFYHFRPADTFAVLYSIWEENALAVGICIDKDKIFKEIESAT